MSKLSDFLTADQLEAAYNRACQDKFKMRLQIAELLANVPYRDELVELEALRAKVAKMQPVVDAALGYREAQLKMIEKGDIMNCDAFDAAEAKLVEAVDAVNRT